MQSRLSLDRTYTGILKKYPCNAEVLGEDRQALLDILLQSDLYRTKASRENVKLEIKMLMFGGRRKHKYLVLSESGKELVVSKGKLLYSIVPYKGELTQLHRNAVLVVMRKLIEEQIYEFKEKRREQIMQLAKDGKLAEARDLLHCPLSGRLLSTCKHGTAVDHIKPFLQLAEEWLISKGLTFSDVLLGGGGISRYIKDEELAKDWQAYHKEHATLQVVCKSANSSKGAGDYKAKLPR